MERQQVLIVDDDAPTRAHLDELVRQLDGVETALASSVAEADSVIADVPIALAILDVDLGKGPDGKYAGLELLSRLNQRCPVIVVSGMQEDAFLRHVSLTLHAWDFIAKPVNDLDFLNKARHALTFRTEVRPQRFPEQGAPLPAGLSVQPNHWPDLLWHNRPVRLTLTQLRLVHALVEKPGTVVEAERLLRLLTTGERGALHTHMAGVRTSFRDVDPAFKKIRNEAGKGYAWEADS